MTSLLAYSVHLDLPPHRKHHQDPQFHGCAPLPSSSPHHKKNNQKNHQGASMTTRQTIASPTPANIKISSPIPKKISRIFGHIFPKISRIPKKNLSHFRTHFPKNLSHPVQNRLFPPNLLKAIQMKQMKQMKQTAHRGNKRKGQL